MKTILALASILLAIGFVLTTYQDKIRAGFDNFFVEENSRQQQMAIGIS